MNRDFSYIIVRLLTVGKAPFFHAVLIASQTLINMAGFARHIAEIQTLNVVKRGVFPSNSTSKK